MKQKSRIIFGFALTILVVVLVQWSNDGIDFSTLNFLAGTGINTSDTLQNTNTDLNIEINSIETDYNFVDYHLSLPFFEEIEWYDNTFFIGERILVTLGLTNTSEEPILVNSNLSLAHQNVIGKVHTVAIIIINPLGEQLECLSSPKPILPKFIQINPNEKIIGQYSLYSYFSCGFDFPGEYTMYAIYSNQIDPDSGEVAWKGEINSNIIKFEFVEPPP